MNGLKSIHWNQLYGNGFFSMATIGNNGMVMVFNGLQPLVKRWNGNDPSLWSTHLSESITLQLVVCLSKTKEPTVSEETIFVSW